MKRGGQRSGKRQESGFFPTLKLGQKKKIEKRMRKSFLFKINFKEYKRMSLD